MRGSRIDRVRRARPGRRAVLPGLPRRLPVLALVAAGLVSGVLTACNPEGTPRQHVGGACRVAVVGDSLAVIARDAGELGARFAGRGCSLVEVDARGSRPSAEGAGIVERWAATGRLPEVLVVVLGTNDCGPQVATQVRRVMAAAGPSRAVVWVDTHRPRCDVAVNDAVRAVQREVNDGAANLWVLGHHGWAATTPGVLTRDRVHLSARGADAYADRVVAAVVDGLD